MLSRMSSRPFNAGEPIAYLITWTTYGTWLPGDERGWQKKNRTGEQSPNQLRQTTSAAEMKETGTEGASCRYINQNDDLESAIAYTIDGQD